MTPEKERIVFQSIATMQRTIAGLFERLDAHLSIIGSVKDIAYRLCQEHETLREAHNESGLTITALVQLLIRAGQITAADLEKMQSVARAELDQVFAQLQEKDPNAHSDEG